jgi:hypothetical protein
MAAAVSSQEVSIPRIFIFVNFIAIPGIMPNQNPKM